MVRPLFDEDIRGSGEGSPLVMPAQVYHVSHNAIYSCVASYVIYVDA